MATWREERDVEGKESPWQRWPSVYDTCPDCGKHKAKKAYRCKNCTPLTRVENAPNWKGDAARSETKRERAQKAFPKLGTCERCDESPATDRHHIDGDTGHNDRANLAFLCRSCHMAVDGRSASRTEGEQFAGGDPKSKKRHRATKAEWEKIRDQFSDQRCLSCGAGDSVSLHHVVPRSQGGDDVAENLVVLCGDGTRGCHGILEAHAPGWERVANAVRVYVILDKDRCLYVVGKLGWERMNNRYPLLSEPGRENVYPGVSASQYPDSPGSESDWERDFLHYEEPVWRYRPRAEEPADDFESELHW